MDLDLVNYCQLVMQPVNLMPLHLYDLDDECREVVK